MEIMYLSTIRTLHKIRKSSGSFLFCQESNILLVNNTQGRFCMEDINWNNKEEVLKLVQHEGLYLKFASKELRNDKDVVLTAVQQSGDTLAYASEQLRNNKEIVLAAVQESGHSLVYASKKTA